MTTEGESNVAPADLPPEVQARHDAEFYCPGCGRPFAYQGECTGATAAAPHQPIPVVPTEELHGDTDDHTPAPNTGP